MVAQLLANDGYKILVIDADIEAPSLQAVFDAATSNLEATLFGCAQYGLLPVPQTVFVPKRGEGQADMIACRPTQSEYDLDFANFALKASLDPLSLQRVIGKVLESKSKYDVILVDHRSGLSTSVIPLVAGFPGPVVVCLRLDEQSDRAEAYFDVLFRLNSANPGLFLSFSLDPEDSEEAMLGRHRERIETLLQGISCSLGLISESGDEDVETTDSVSPEPDDLIGYWIPWFHDRSFFARKLPPVDSILAINQRSLLTMRELLGLGQAKLGRGTVAPMSRDGVPNLLTSSGSTDSGTLIETDAIRKLRFASTPYSYILGRKGTGKTRLVRALVEARTGEPLLVADDFPLQEGVSSSDPSLADLAATVAQSDPSMLWWALLDAVLENRDRASQQRRLTEITLELRLPGGGGFTANSVKDKILRLAGKRVFLIDGVETAFNATRMSSFVEGLFRFLGAVQSDVAISQLLTIRLFIRTDLAEGARENIQQQMENRVLWLAWDAQTILNFVLARIANIDWFRESFRYAITLIQNRAADIVKGAVAEPDCNSILLEIFPQKLRRNNLLTLTFLKTYFSDGQGDLACYYPRIYDSFLQFIAAGGPPGLSSVREKVENGRVAQNLIFSAHDYACKEYLKQVKDELKNLLFFADGTDNQQLISDFLDGFSGMKTPFVLDECIAQLAAKLASRIEDSSAIRKAMLQMKRVGIFEDRPGYPGVWRVGRLFKSSLGMRYQR
jgi:hypothetical protein